MRYMFFYIKNVIITRYVTLPLAGSWRMEGSRSWQAVGWWTTKRTLTTSPCWTSCWRGISGLTEPSVRGSFLYYSLHKRVSFKHAQWNTWYKVVFDTIPYINMFLWPRHSKNGGGVLSVTPVRSCVRPSVRNLVSAQLLLKDCIDSIQI